MSNKPVLCLHVNEETQLRLFEERHEVIRGAHCNRERTG